MPMTTKAMMDKALSVALKKKNSECEHLAARLSAVEEANGVLVKRAEASKADAATSDKIMDEALLKAQAADKREKETRAQFDDLKSRLFDATKRIEYLTGYLARVQEDDHVREVLVSVGDPEGEQSLVPKRKHKVIAGEDHSEGRDGANALIYEKARSPYDEPARSAPRRWVSY